jgi:hypothetical protein
VTTDVLAASALDDLIQALRDDGFNLGAPMSKEVRRGVDEVVDRVRREAMEAEQHA